MTDKLNEYTEKNKSLTSDEVTTLLKQNKQKISDLIQEVKNRRNKDEDNRNS